MPFPEWYFTMDCEQKTAALRRWAEKVKHLSFSEREKLEASVQELAKQAEKILGLKNNG